MILLNKCYNNNLVILEGNKKIKNSIRLGNLTYIVKKWNN